MRKSFILTTLLLLPLLLMAKGVKIIRATCELKNGLVVTDNYTPKFCWQMESDENGTTQTAYELEIRDRLTDNIVYTRGKVKSDSCQLIAVPLKEGAYTWRVRVWDEADKASEWCDTQTLMVENPQTVFGGSRWIGALARDRYPQDTLSARSILLRKDFALRGIIKRAYVYVSGLGSYELAINGKKVGDAEFAPAWSNYDKTVFYNTYDVTEYVKKGNNFMQAMLGNGFYNERGGRYHKLLTQYGPPTLRLRLQVVYQSADGKEMTISEILSDASWQYALSPITFNSIYGGEDYDARLENPRVGDAHLWHPAVEQEAPKGVLRPQYAEPVKIMETYGVKSVTGLTPEAIAKASVTTKRQIDKSAFVLDMGQNLAGFPQITVTGKRGQKITLLVSETLTDEGACDQRQTGRPHYYVYTLRGGVSETWHPRFSYYGFQYIQVEGAVLKGQPNPDNLPVISDIHSCFIYNSAREVSTFECSNERINKIHRLIERAERSNMQSIFTDCPHREKLGWLEQDYLNGYGLLLNYDMAGMLQQTMRNIADAQMDNGAVPTTAPEYVVFKGKGMDVFRESPEWGGAIIFVPCLYWQKYKDPMLIQQYYPAMKKYLNYLNTRAKDYVLDFGLGDWFDYAPGKAGFSRNTPVALVATAHYYMWAELMQNAAHLCHQNGDVKVFGALADSIKVAFNKHFYHADTHQYGTGSQTSNSIALCLSLVHPADAKAVLANLVNDIHQHGNRLTTGDVGNLYLFSALAENHLDSLLYLMINHDDVPGYGYQIKQGATTLTEQWDPRQGNSRNHFMMGQIDEIFFAYLAGVPRFAPRIVGDINYAKATTETRYGMISSSWSLKGDEFTYKIHVPVGERANVKMPGESNSRQVGSGNYTFTTKIVK